MRKQDGAAHEAIGVYISGLHARPAWLERQIKHLHRLERAGLIEVWNLASIPPGAPRQVAVENWLDRAAVAILFLDVDALDHELTAEVEIPRLLSASRDGRLQLLPLLAAPCDLPEELAVIQRVHFGEACLAAMTPWERDAVFVRVARFVAKAAAASVQRAG